MVSLYNAKFLCISHPYVIGTFVYSTVKYFQGHTTKYFQVHTTYYIGLLAKMPSWLFLLILSCVIWFLNDIQEQLMGLLKILSG